MAQTANTLLVMRDNRTINDSFEKDKTLWSITHNVTARKRQVPGERITGLETPVHTDQENKKGRLSAALEGNAKFPRLPATSGQVVLLRP